MSGRVTYTLRTVERSEGFATAAARDSVDEAADIFDGKRAFGVLIVDIMMPPGHFTADGRNEKGLTTGLEFIRFLREKKGIRTPMIVLTNTEDEEVLQRAESYPGVIVRDKLSELPSLLVETVRSLLTA